MTRIAAFYILCCLAAIARAQTEVCRDADVADHPYHLSFWLQGNFRCSAALLSAHHAITSFHCLNKVPEGWVWTLRSLDGLQERTVASWYGHPQNLQYDYDLVILTVSEEFVLSNALSPVQLPAADELLSPGAVTTVTAFSREEFGTELFLNTWQIPILDYEVCMAIYGPPVMRERMYCAGVEQGDNSTTCQMNSGAPMVVGTKLVGFYTVGYSGIRPDYPSAYTKIGLFRDWINAVTGV